MFPDEIIQLQLDNAKPHLKYAKEYLEVDSRVFHALFQPPSSPDLMPIEFVRKKLKQDVYKSTITDIEELIKLVKKSWKNLRLNIIQNCIDHDKKT